MKILQRAKLFLALSNKAEDLDTLGDRIEATGRNIDLLSDQMEKAIYKNGIGIDSPEAQKAVEERGHAIDELSDFMDRLVERRGTFTNQHESFLRIFVFKNPGECL